MKPIVYFKNKLTQDAILLSICYIFLIVFLPLLDKFVLSFFFFPPSKAVGIFPCLPF